MMPTKLVVSVPERNIRNILSGCDWSRTWTCMRGGRPFHFSGSIQTSKMTVDEVIDRDKLENLFSIKFINKVYQ